MKRLRVSVDVLTLTATPIPEPFTCACRIRTSARLKPRRGPRAIETYVRNFDDLTIREAMYRELHRGRADLFRFTTTFQDHLPDGPKAGDAGPERAIAVDTDR